MRAQHQAYNELATLREAIPTLVESYLMERLHATVYPWLQQQYANEDQGHLADLLFFLRHHTPADISIRPEFQCSLKEAAQEISMLSAAVTPLEKLLVLKRTCAAVRAAVQRNVDDHRSLHQARTRPRSAHMDGEEEEGEVSMATDDLIDGIIYAIIQVTL